MTSKQKMMVFLARRTPSHAVEITAYNENSLLKVRRLRAVQGALPNCSDLLGTEWPSRSALKEEVLKRMRDLVD